MGVTFLAWLGAFFGSLLSSIAAEEYKHGAVSFAERIVVRAAERLPEHVKETYEEEWLALINDLKSPTARIAHAISLYIKAGSLAALLEGANSRRAAQTIRCLDLMISTTSALLLLPFMALVMSCLVIENPRRFPLRRYRVSRKGGCEVVLYAFNTKTAPGQKSAFSRSLIATDFQNIPMLINVIRGDIAFFARRPIGASEDAPQVGLVPLIGEMDGSGRAALRCWMLSCFDVLYRAFLRDGR